jgi:hypothetical protein
MTKLPQPRPPLSPNQAGIATAPVPLAQAAVEVQLAVDLIMLLEQQQLPPQVILAALDIVQADFRRTHAAEQSTR